MIIFLLQITHPLRRKKRATRAQSTQALPAAVVRKEVQQGSADHSVTILMAAIGRKINSICWSTSPKHRTIGMSVRLTRKRIVRLFPDDSVPCVCLCSLASVHYLCSLVLNVIPNSC